MVTVAIAGASSGLGLAIAKQILLTKKHTLIVLSRNSNPTLAALGASVKTVDYTSHSSLVSIFKDEKVDTVLSLLGGNAQAAFATVQLALIAAAKEAGVKRFAPSEFATATYAGVEAYRPKYTVWEAVKASGMEYTRFSPGIFMNIAGFGTPKGEEEALGGLRPFAFVLDIQDGRAILPGDGTDPVAFTETSDIGRFVAASLDLEKWEEDMGMVGELSSYRGLVNMVEKVTGRKFLLKEASVESLQKEIEGKPGEEVNFMHKFYNQALMLSTNGDTNVEPFLNAKFPDIKPVQLQEYIEKWWSGVQLPEPGWKDNGLFK